MQVRPNTNLHLTTIKFRLIDPNQFKINSSENSALIEAHSPALGQAVAEEMNAMVRKISTNILRAATMKAIGFEVELELLTAQSFNDTEENQLKVQEAIKKCIPLIFDPRVFNSEPEKIVITTEQTDITNAKYRGKVEKRSYSYNKLDATVRLEVQFIDENAHPVMNLPHSQKMQYNAFGNITEIAYTYNEYIPNPSHLDKLQKEVNEYCKQHRNCSPFLISIKAKDFNQALRRACTAGNLYLVKLLIQYDAEHSLNLDFNQKSTNGNSVWDYAFVSDNLELIELLKSLNALPSKDLRHSLVNADREKIMSLNPPRHDTADVFARYDYTLPFADKFAPRKDEIERFRDMQINAKKHDVFARLNNPSHNPNPFADEQTPRHGMGFMGRENASMGGNRGSSPFLQDSRMVGSQQNSPTPHDVFARLNNPSHNPNPFADEQTPRHGMGFMGRENASMRGKRDSSRPFSRNLMGEPQEDRTSPHGMFGRYNNPHQMGPGDHYQNPDPFNPTPFSLGGRWGEK